MAEIEKKTMDKSLEEVITALNENKSFLLEAGAGSGKTWTLIESLKYLIVEKGVDLNSSNKRIACITYTNVAKDEIQERIEYNPLVVVSTIHDFLWAQIANFQAELKKALLAFNNEQTNRQIEGLEEIIKDKRIEYWNYGRNFEEGKISHDDVILLSQKLFLEYPKIAYLVSNKFPYVFIDEYQDTDPKTVDLLLNGILQNNQEKFLLGFFGDSMQQIYDGGVGKISDDRIIQIQKDDNFRCSKKVIDLLNHIRMDLTQKPAGDNLEGEISFLYPNSGDNQSDYDSAVKFLEEKHGWNLSPNSTKVLFLTHKGIAQKAGYQNLLNLYSDAFSFGRDRLMDRTEPYISFLIDKIELILQLYINKSYPAFLEVQNKDGFSLNWHKQKEDLSKKMETLRSIRINKSIGEVISFVIDEGLLKKTEKIIDFETKLNSELEYEKKDEDKQFSEKLMKTPYVEVVYLNEFIQESTPFSTKHGVKGAEFDNVLVVIDDNSWKSRYKFNDVFAGNLEKQGRYNRSLNLLYVCCSRAKNKLAILPLSGFDNNALTTVANWFGQENIYKVI